MEIGNLETFEWDTGLDFPNGYLLGALYAMTGYLHYIFDTREDFLQSREDPLSSLVMK
jgi:hypothetical protein